LFQIEYQVESCSKGYNSSSDCIDVRKTSLSMQTGGYVIYGVGHVHAAATASTLFAQVLFNNYFHSQQINILADLVHFLVILFSIFLLLYTSLPSPNELFQHSTANVQGKKSSM